jgi:hypothetical protein
MKISLSCDRTLGRRSIKMNLANEGFEARKKEEEVTAKKRKAENDARWEGIVLSRLYGSSWQFSCPPHRNSGTARGQLAFLRQYIEKEEKAEGRRSWLRTYPVPYLFISRPGD